MSNTDNDIVTGREKVLNGARDAVMQDRSKAYGPPEDNFKDIAYIWNWYIRKHHIDTGTPLQAHHVGAMMRLVKETRLITSPENLDHYVDIAGYAACQYQCIENSGEEG